MAIELINQTPFLSNAWDYLNSKGEAYGVALLRGRFMLQLDELTGEWRLHRDSDQGELFTEDQFYGEPGHSSVRYETDYISYKSGTDIIANAVARTQGEQLKEQWRCGIQVSSKQNKVLCSKVLRVTGSRHWQAKLLTWKLTSPEPCSEVAIRYENAYGGSSKKKDSQGKLINYLSFDNYNPVGVGNKHPREKVQMHIAPQIESSEQPIGDFFDDYKVQGFGFIHRSWQPRQQLAGSYDDDWLDNQHPLLPHDFKLEYNRSASTGMALEKYLMGGETIVLKSFLSQHQIVRFKLPEYSFYSNLILDDGGQLLQPLLLDTVLLDIEDDDIKKWRIYLSWRGQHILPEEAKSVELFGVDNQQQEGTNGVT